MMWRIFIISTVILPSFAVMAGPPYVSDDPEPTDYKHYEIYAFSNGTMTRDGTNGVAGIDFNYGAAPDLQLTAVLPLGYDTPTGKKTAAGLGNIEIAAKYRFLHQNEIGWDVSVFPRLFLSTESHAGGEQHTSFLLPLWVGKDWDKWATFGGGGCVINRGGDSQNFCLVGWAVTRQVLPDLRLGIELYHQTATTRDGVASSGAGAGIQYDLNEHYHLMASFGPGIENASQNNQTSWYAALLYTL
jgi:hypothetical protein